MFLLMFEVGTIWAYPTNTSFGLGARCDDLKSLARLKKLKNRSEEKWFSLMVRDWEMLKKYAEVPENITPDWFTDKPRTALLKPKKLLPQTTFWPTGKVAFRICTIPEVAQHIVLPVTATSANLSGEDPVFCTQNLFDNFGNQVQIYAQSGDLRTKDPSEIWDLTVNPIVQVR